MPLPTVEYGASRKIAIFATSRRTLNCIAAASLAACGGSQPPIGTPGPMPQSHAIVTHAEHGGSWMLPEASDELLYITNYSTVLVYTYPQLKHVMTLKGFYSASAACIDAAGNVYVTNERPVAIYEYQHGGSKRIKTFRLKRGGADGCAIDPTSGDLAVSGNGSTVTIFDPRGKQRTVNDRAMFYNYYCTYDTNGDLFVDGLANATGKTRLAELRQGTRAFVGVSSDTPLALTDNIQWDGRYLNALYYVHSHHKQYIPFIAQLSIRQTKATKASAYSLGTPAYTVLQYYISGNMLFVPNWYYEHGQQLKNLLVYSYPSGGSPTTVFSKVDDPRGAVLSPARR